LGVSVEVFLQLVYKKAVFDDYTHHLADVHKE
jgi:hypothetical protein